MKSPAWIVLAVSVPAAFAADGGSRPPVLQPLEPSDSVVFRLPGAPKADPRPAVPSPATAPTAEPPLDKVVAVPPQPQASPLPGKLVKASLPKLPAVPRKPAAATGTKAAVKSPASQTAKGAMAPEIAREVAFYCQKQIGRWTEANARELLGAPLRSRAAYDEHKRPDGKIYAFRDPTQRYRELELDFESKTGTLRSVYVYPRRMTWQDVRQRWQGEVSSAEAPQGRTFYSYMNRHLDVLVDPEGKVISLGLY